MNSDPLADIGGIIVSFALLSAFIVALVIGAFAAPFIGAGAIPVIAYLYYRNSPQTKEREAKERTHALYQQALKASPRSFDRNYADRVEAACGDREIVDVAYELFVDEGLDRPDKPPPICNSIEAARYRDQVTAYINNAHTPEKVDGFMAAVIAALPKRQPPQGMFQGFRRLSNDEIEDLLLPFFGDHNYFLKLRRQVDKNLNEQNGVMPSNYKGDNCAFAYMKDTPLLRLEKRSFGIDLPARTEHMHILGGTGAGKTNLIQHMILKDLEDDCTVIVIDSQRQMIPKIAALDLPLDDITYISPEHTLGINLFDVRFESIQRDREAERLINAATELLEFVLSSLMDAKLTAKQQVVFQFAIQLTISIPNANIHTFREILAPNGTQEYQRYVEALPDEVREFFRTEFDDKQFNETKKELNWRIWSLLKNPTFRRLFAATKNPIDMFEEMQNRRLILIDTNQNLLQDVSSFFGRLFVAQILLAAQRRFEGRHRPVYVYIDEAWAYFDDRLARMLDTARKANIGIILAHQNLAQAKEISGPLMSSTGIKFASTRSASDAGAMAANMRTTAEFIQDQPRHHFAAHLKGTGTLSVAAPHADLDALPKRTDDIREEMERRYGYVQAAPPPKPLAEEEEFEDEEIIPG